MLRMAFLTLACLLLFPRFLARLDWHPPKYVLAQVDPADDPPRIGIPDTAPDPDSYDLPDQDTDDDDDDGGDTAVC